MLSPEVRAAIASYIGQQAQPPDKYSHQPRLYQLALNIAEGQQIDDDVLYAAAWLHDLGVFIGHRPEDPVALAAWDNIAYAAAVVPGLLQQWGFPEQKIAAVIAAIETHLPAQQPTSMEGIVLRDADILEQLGAIAILRIVSKVGRDTRFHTFSDAVGTLQRAVDQLPQQLMLPRAQELALPRIQILQAFLAAAHFEAGGIPV